MDAKLGVLNRTRNDLIAKATEKQEAAKTIGWQSRELSDAGLSVPRAITLASLDPDVTT